MELVALATMCTQPGQLKRQKLKDLVKSFGDRMDGGGMFRVERKTLKFEFVMDFTWLVDEFCGEGFALKLLTNKSLSGPITDEIIELLNYTPVAELSDEVVADLSDEAKAELKAAAQKKEDFITKILKWFNVFRGSGRRNITKARNKLIGTLIKKVSNDLVLMSNLKVNRNKKWCPKEEVYRRISLPTRGTKDVLKHVANLVFSQTHEIASERISCIDGWID